MGQQGVIDLSIRRRDFLRASALFGVAASVGVGMSGNVWAQATVNVRNYGAAGDSVQNDTEAFRQAIEAVSAGGTVLVPAGFYMLDASADQNRALRLKSNMKLRLQAGARLQTIHNALPRHYLLWIDDAENVEIFGDAVSGVDAPEIVGDRDNHNGTEGEWGQGIRIVGGSNNIVIRDLRIMKFWGDGITVGRNSTGTPQNVTISRVRSLHNRRQGLSIISANGIDVLDSEFSYTDGTLPQAGIDIEPDAGGSEVRGVFISGCLMRNNTGNGLLIDGNKGPVNDVEIRGCFIEHNRGYGVYTQGANGVWMVQNYRIRNNYWHGVYVASSSLNHTIQLNRFVNNRVGFRAPSTAPVCIGPIDGLPTEATRHIDVRPGADCELIANTYCS